MGVDYGENSRTQSGFNVAFYKGALFIIESANHIVNLVTDVHYMEIVLDL